MKGYDTIKRYCGRLENRLKNTENCQADVEEIRQHLIEQTESYIAEGCLPEAAELLAIEEMGSDALLAAQLKKYREKLPADEDGFFETVKDFKLKTELEYTAANVMLKNINSMKWRELFYPVLIALYIGVIWIILCIPETAYEPNRPFWIRMIGIMCIISVTAFSLLLSSLDRYRPYFCRKNILWLLGALAAGLIGYMLVKIVLLYGTYYIINNVFVFFVAEKLPRIFYIVQKLVLAAVFAGIVHFALKEEEKYTAAVAVSALAPLTGLFMPADMLGFLWPAILLFAAAASIYITLYCKNKYAVRIIVQCFCLMGLAETAALYLINI